MNMTLHPVLQSGRAHEHTRGRVRPVLGGQSVVAIVGDYVVCGCIYEVFRASACPALLQYPRRNRVAPMKSRLLHEELYASVAYPPLQSDAFHMGVFPIHYKDNTWAR